MENRRRLKLFMREHNAVGQGYAWLNLEFFSISTNHPWSSRIIANLHRAPFHLSN